MQSQVSPAADAATIHAVMAGDNLSKIAKHFYRGANAWKWVFDVNRGQPTDPDRIEPGRR